MANKTDIDENIRIGKMLQIARERKNVMQQEVADVVNLSKNHLSKVERGESKASISLLLGYCKKLNMTPNEILGFLDGEILPELKKALESMDKDSQTKVLDMIKIMGR